MAEPTPAEYLKLARAHLERAQAAATDPVDWTDVSTYGLYCLEAAVMAAGGHVGMDVVKSHVAKAEAAVQLARKYKLPDISGLLPDLNTSRKAHAYGDIEAPDLDAEDISTELEEFVDAVEELLTTKAAKRKR
jgi:hypothetical protein